MIIICNNNTSKINLWNNQVMNVAISWFHRKKDFIKFLPITWLFKLVLEYDEHYPTNAVSDLHLKLVVAYVKEPMWFEGGTLDD